MKSYVKPTLEVISMRTSENIADNNIIKTIYTKTEVSGNYGNAKTGAYVASEDVTFSNASIQ